MDFAPFSRAVAQRFNRSSQGENKMSDKNNLFELASIHKYRFPASIGELTLEQIYDLPLDGSKNGVDLDTIARSPFDDADRKTVMAEYLRTLDLSAALRDAEDARQRRERMAAVERDRAEREGQTPATTPTIDTRSTMTPEQVSEFLHATPVTSDGPQATYSFIMPAQTVGGFSKAQVGEIVAFFKRFGFHGSTHKEEQ